MRFFIASPWRNRTAVEQLTEELTKRGYDAYSYLQSGANLSTGISIEEELKTFSSAMVNWENDQNIKKIFDSELDGLKQSDAVILLEPAGRSSLLEAGIGYGMGKEIIVIGVVERPEVFYLIAQHFYRDTDEFLGSLPSAAK
ncbi:MAG TPA: hypothetical protein VMT81_02345 [Candidatus Paceibacterota bacterium]|nr:hypothetical protein [Candidatus Paceibacterota bacterium]